MPDLVPIRRALLSVSDKTDLVPFAKSLAERGVELISTGGTARALADAGLEVIPIDRVTGFPEMMDGRVKTLHPKVHGGLLALRDNDEHAAAMKEHGITPIDLVCINLYPFEQTIAKEGVSLPEAIEQIDIGGPSMVRSAAKNHAFVTVVTGPRQYDKVVNELSGNNGATTERLRFELAAAAFARTADYDATIADYLGKQARRGQRDGAFPQSFAPRFTNATELRYGENPHQQGCVYTDPASTEASVAKAQQLHGKGLSFCNLYDADGALGLVKEIDPADHAAVSVIKHANPCGFAVGDDLAAVFEQAYAGDPLAAFGGIVALNRPVDLATAKKIVDGQKFLEVIVAPSFADDALGLLRERWKNARLLAVGEVKPVRAKDVSDFDQKKIAGGLLVQERDLLAVAPDTWEHAAGPEPTPQQLLDMRVATVAVKHLKSNAVCIVKDSALVGAGAGQMDRVAACKLSVEKAGGRAAGAAVGSDAFFPFRDGPDLLIGAGVKSIAQPGGSKRDDETIAACNDAGVTLMFTGKRHFRH